MKKKEFIKELVDFCEFENTDLTFDTKLQSIDGFDSMSVMSIIAFVDENFNTKITGVQIYALTDFNSFIDLIGQEKFEND